MNITEEISPAVMRTEKLPTKVRDKAFKRKKKKLEKVIKRSVKFSTFLGAL